MSLSGLGALSLSGQGLVSLGLTICGSGVGGRSLGAAVSQATSVGAVSRFCVGIHACRAFGRSAGVGTPAEVALWNAVVFLTRRQARDIPGAGWAEHGRRRQGADVHSMTDVVAAGTELGLWFLRVAPEFSVMINYIAWDGGALECNEGSFGAAHHAG